MEIIDREARYAIEESWLSADAGFSKLAMRRGDASEDWLRTDYQKDRDKILHSKSFRRLSHKTQVFLAVEGDHFRTRLTHTLEVSQIARTISRALGLNEDLTEAIALGHDLGHTPFGHIGEEALTDCLRKYANEDEPPYVFRHNEQSLRVVDIIENDGRGLNLTDAVRDGIVHHTGSVSPKTLEGRVVAISDRIAYVNHDIDDAIRAGLLDEDRLPESTIRVLGNSHAERIETLVHDMVRTSSASDDVRMSDEVWAAMDELRSFLFANVYRSDAVMCEVAKAQLLISSLFDYLMSNPDLVPCEYNAISNGNALVSTVDYIAGMTDRYAIDFHKRLFIPQPLG